MTGTVAGQIVACVAVAVISGGLYRLGSGLRPIAAAAWLAPLPLLLLAPRVPWFAAAGVAAAAWTVGQLGFWSYYTRDLSMRHRLVAAQFVGSGLAVAAIVALARAHLVHGRLVLAALAVPLAWAAMEFLVALRSPHGAWWSLAYTQADTPAVTQVASLTGVWGVSALLALPASAAAAAMAPVGSGDQRVAVLAIAATIVTVLMGYAWLRRRRAKPGASVHVGLAAVAQPGDPVSMNSPEGASLVSRYAAKVRLLSDRGARVIVLPESTFAIDDRRTVDQLRPFAELATELGVDIVVGVARLGETAPANLAMVFGADGRPSSPYQKHHLLPGLEAMFRPGRDLQYVSSDRRLGLIICKDLDFPGLARAYRRGGAGLLLGPAWDFGRDGWLHSRMAVLRGVESGVAVARVARGGRATVSDAFGRVLVEADAAGGTAVDGVVPLAATATVYSRLGDWFGWCCVAATVAAALGPP